jgi:hypothetical protein
VTPGGRARQKGSGKGSSQKVTCADRRGALQHRRWRRRIAGVRVGGLGGRRGDGGCRVSRGKHPAPSPQQRACIGRLGPLRAAPGSATVRSSDGEQGARVQARAEAHRMRGRLGRVAGRPAARCCGVVPLDAGAARRNSLREVVGLTPGRPYAPGGRPTRVRQKSDLWRWARLVAARQVALKDDWWGGWRLWM